jgi:hypothetical protein
MKAQEKVLIEVKTPRIFDTEKIYLEYCNDFLTVEGIADYYGLPVRHMKFIIDNGRNINHEKHHAKKETILARILNLINKQ